MVSKIGISRSRGPVSGELFGKVMCGKRCRHPPIFPFCGQDAKSQAQTLSNKETSSMCKCRSMVWENDGILQNDLFVMYHFNRGNYVCLPLDMLRFNVAMFLITKVHGLETPRSKKQLVSICLLSFLNLWKQTTKPMEDPKMDSSLLTLLR